MNKDEIINIISNANVQNADVIAIFYNKVCVGKYENGQIKFDENVNYSLCNQMRVFNKELEIRLISKNGKILSKKIDDKSGIDSFDECMFLRNNTKNRLVVRNYLNIDKNNQVMIDDSRLVEFVTTEKEGV